MVKKKSKKWQYIFVLLLLAIPGYYMGFLFKTAMSSGMFSIRLFMDGVDRLSASPFIFSVSRYTFYSVAALEMAGSLWVLYDYSLPNNYRPNAEYGTTRWGEVKEVCRRLADRDQAYNRILSQNLRVSFNTRQTDLNNNGIIIGGSGSSKTFRGVSPNLYNIGNADHGIGRISLVVTDPKGELLARHGTHLKDKGYQIKVFNLLRPDCSDRYNPFRYVRSVEDIYKLAHNFIENTTDKAAQKGDSFWTDSAEAMFAAACLYVWMQELPKKKNLVTVTDLLSKAKISDDGEPSELDMIMEALPDDHPALVAYKKATIGAADTVRSILATLNSRLRSMTTDKIQRILSDDDMKIEELGIGKMGDQKTRTAIFLVIPDNDKTFNYLIGMFYTQMFQELYRQADFVFNGRLPLHVSIWMDEFANVSLPDGFASLESTMRSREISVQVILQNLSQIKDLFKGTWETILGNADTLVFLGGNEQTTTEYISKRLGDETIDKKSDSRSRGKSGSVSISHDHMAHTLLKPDEAGRLDKNQCIIIVRGELPLLDDKYETLNDPIFQKYKDTYYKHPNQIVRDRSGKIIYSNVDKEEDVVLPLSKKSLDYYKKAEAAGEKVVVYTADIHDILSMRPEELTLKVRDQYLNPPIPSDDEPEAPVPSGGSTAEGKELTAEDIYQKPVYRASANDAQLYDLVQKMMDTMDGQQRYQILLGYQHGLSSEEISLYADPSFNAEKMEKRRKEIEMLRKKYFAA